MITAGTVVGKMAGFIASKAATHVASLALDKRRKACRALTKLYFWALLNFKWVAGHEG
jgi:hypothetical protein